MIIKGSLHGVADPFYAARFLIIVGGARFLQRAPPIIIKKRAA